MLNRFLAALPARQRQLFLARYWYGLSIQELAERFGFSQSKVKSLLYRIRCSLRHTLEKEGYG